MDTRLIHSDLAEKFPLQFFFNISVNFMKKIRLYLAVISLLMLCSFY